MTGPGGPRPGRSPHNPLGFGCGARLRLAVEGWSG